VSEEEVKRQTLTPNSVHVKQKPEGGLVTSCRRCRELYLKINLPNSDEKGDGKEALGGVEGVDLNCQDHAL